MNAEKIKFSIDDALPIAERVLKQLTPHCIKIEIAGSIRRKKLIVGDIEIVAIPKPYEVGLFANGIAPIVNKWEKVKGELPCKYTQRILPEGIKLDLFFAESGNWGNILAIRTGSTEFSKRKLAFRWKDLGFKSKEGYLWRESRKYECPTEKDFFKLLRINYVEPEFRNL